jgi:hypothetical protein
MNEGAVELAPRRFATMHAAAAVRHCGGLKLQEMRPIKMEKYKTLSKTP